MWKATDSEAFMPLYGGGRGIPNGRLPRPGAIPARGAAFLIFLCLFFTALVGNAESQAPLPTPEQALQRLKAGNRRFVDGKLESPDQSAEKRSKLALGQQPFAIVLSCADSRVVPEFLFNVGMGDLFVLRVAGNIADQYELGSIEYAIEHLHTPLIVVLGHEKCGAVGAALTAKGLSGNLGMLIREVRVGENLPPDKEAALTTAVRNNTRTQARSLAERSEVIRDQIAIKKLRVVGGVYQLSSGKIDWLEDK